MLKLSGLPTSHSRGASFPGKFRKRYVMSTSLHPSGTTFVSRYEQRVMFVQDVLRKNPALDEKASHELAVQVVYAIDHIQEPSR
jgi:hypothetical protein